MKATERDFASQELVDGVLKTKALTVVPTVVLFCSPLPPSSKLEAKVMSNKNAR